MPRIYGYARCSTRTQQVDSQVEQLKKAGCTKCFSEKISSRIHAAHRPQLQAVLHVLEPGDSIWLTRLDRCGRSATEVVNILNDLHNKGVFVRTLDGLYDSKNLGKMAPLVVGLLTGLAEVERNLIVERSRESVEYRRMHGGSLGGRPTLPKIKTDHIRKLRDEGNSLRKIVTLTGVSLSAVQKVCKQHEAKVS